MRALHPWTSTRCEERYWITGGRGIGGVNRAVRRKNGPEETAIIHARKDLIALRDDRL